MARKNKDPNMEVIDPYHYYRSKFTPDYGIYTVKKEHWDRLSHKEQIGKEFDYAHWHHEDQVFQAKRLAERAHAKQTDIAGVPYIQHVQRVAERVAWCGDDVVAVAWLHDVVEDTVVTQELINLFFSETVARGVEAMTQRKGEPLESYWRRVAANREAFIVKLHGDMPDNNDPSRFAALDTHKAIKIGSKYASAIDFFWQQGFAPKPQQKTIGISGGNPDTLHPWNHIANG